LASRLRDGTPAESISGFIGAGADKSAFKARSGHDDIVVKFMHNPGDQELTTASALPLLRSQGVDHLEQLRAVDRTCGIMVTNFLPGKVVSELSSSELFGIKKRHLSQLDETLASMRERGLHPHNTGGVLFDKKHGFSFADYTFEGLYNNFGDIDNTADFLYYALADHKKFDALQAAEINGAPVSNVSYKTTGLRALRRAYLIRKIDK
jgi:hypothetical protein